MSTIHEMAPPERTADADEPVRSDTDVDVVRTWPTTAMDHAWPSFRDAAARYGYDETSASTMFAALPSLHLEPDVAATWMGSGFTTWGTRVWLEAGFDADAVDEALEYQRWRFSAEEAFWARRDGTSRADLAARRRLFELLSGH
jgi:hypothetical protein